VSLPSGSASRKFPHVLRQSLNRSLVAGFVTPAKRAARRRGRSSGRQGSAEPAGIPGVQRRRPGKPGGFRGRSPPPSTKNPAEGHQRPHAYPAGRVRTRTRSLPLRIPAAHHPVIYVNARPLQAPIARVLVEMFPPKIRPYSGPVACLSHSSTAGSRLPCRRTALPAIVAARTVTSLFGPWWYPIIIARMSFRGGAESSSPETKELRRSNRVTFPLRGRPLRARTPLENSFSE